MSGSQNVIENMSLNITVEDRYSSIVSERNLYSFAQGVLLETIDEVLKEVDVEENVKLDSLTLDLKVENNTDPFEQIAKTLRAELKSKLKSVVLKSQTTPVTTMLAEVYRQHLPMEKTSALEHRFDELADRWNEEHKGEKFNPLNFSESIIKMMQAENPNMDIQQIACVVYQRIVQAKNAKKSKDNKSSQNEHDIADSSKMLYETADSGLVLISAYLPVLFERTGCVVKGAFVSEDAKMKALSFLKYATFGQYKEPPRNAAVMNLLCGLPVTPVFAADDLPKLSDEEKALVDSLHTAIISNWSAVGHMSPDGLRSTYLVRAGTVETSGATDLLTVENKTFDILVDRLPWAFSVIKHPWMKKVLNVKWR